MQIYNLISIDKICHFTRIILDENATILYWKYKEEDHFDAEELIEPENLEKTKDHHPKKLIEHLMVRKLLKMVLPDRKILYKTAGEPYLYACRTDFYYSFFSVCRFGNF